MSLEKKVKRNDIKKLILKTVQIAGVIGIGLVAPNVLGSMQKLGFSINKRQNESIKRSRQDLIKNNFLEYKDGHIKITEKGQEYLFKELSFENKKKPKKWDGKWRVIVFDIPEIRRKDRDLVRKSFVSFGFMKLQNSVWIYPYDCEDFVNLLKANMKIGKNLLYMIVEELEYDKPIREYFNLK